jgi:hypothetical protein
MTAVPKALLSLSLVRHGQTETPLSGQHSGTTTIPLILSHNPTHPEIRVMALWHPPRPAPTATLMRPGIGRDRHPPGQA